MASQATRTCIHCGGGIPQDAPSNHTTCSEECRKLGLMNGDLETANTKFNEVQAAITADPNRETHTIKTLLDRYMTARDAMADAIARRAHSEGQQRSKDLEDADTALVNALNASTNTN